MTELVPFSHVPAPSSQLHWEGIHNLAELHMQVTSASVTTKEMPRPPVYCSNRSPCLFYFRGTQRRGAPRESGSVSFVRSVVSWTSQAVSRVYVTTETLW